MKRGATAVANGNEPVPKLGKRAPVPLMELDFDKLEPGTKVEPGSQGDRFVRLNYEGSRLEIALKTLPNWARGVAINLKFEKETTHFHHSWRRVASMA